MKRRWEGHGILAGLLTLLVLVFPAMGAAKVYIDIDAPGFQKFPIAVDVFTKGDGTTDQEGNALWFPDRLSKYLDMTGYFRIIPRSAFLEDPRKDRTKIVFSDWRTIGADYLVQGRFQSQNRRLTVEMRLYDTVRGEVLREKRFTGGSGDRKEMTIQFVNEILLALTGERGVFNTRIAYVLKRGNNSELHAIGYDGEGLERITNYGSLTLAPRWSPNGRHISFTSYKDGNPDFFVRDMKTGVGKKVAGYPGLNLSGAWSPDGRKILLTLSKDGNQELYALEVGSGHLQRLTYEYAIDVSPAWSPDGTKIAFVSNRSGSPQIYVMDSDGRNVRRLTYEGNYNTSPSWSPKGNRIAYEGVVGGAFQIFVIGVEGGTPQQLTVQGGEHKHPSWSPDGRYLAMTAKGRGGGKIAVMNANGTNLRILCEGANPAWSPFLE
ncbi:MAG: Tol-Pal system beta propeller repeat protein TolB [Pseudomonadota bacterium]|nr:Tol-Pal system beta propeller repeat protein TolB [Pseudomonadota bacterium]